jgi:hypothetical protein
MRDFNERNVGVQLGGRNSGVNSLRGCQTVTSVSPFDSRRLHQPSPTARCARGFGWQAALRARHAKVVRRSSAGALADALHSELWLAGPFLPLAWAIPGASPVLSQRLARPPAWPTLLSSALTRRQQLPTRGGTSGGMRRCGGIDALGVSTTGLHLPRAPRPVSPPSPLELAHRADSYGRRVTRG